MNRVPLIVRLMLVVSALLLPVTWIWAQEELTLERAIEKALRANPELAVDGPERAVAVAELQASRAGYLPRLDVEQSLLGGNNPIYVFGTLLTQRRFTAANFGLPSLNMPDSVKNLQTRVVGQQNIWDFGRTRQRSEAAKLGIDLTDQAHEEHLKQTLLAVIRDYYAVSLAREDVSAADASLQSAQSIAAQAKSRVDAGLAVDADLLRSQTNLAFARRQQIQARSRMELATAVLNRLMGDLLDTPIGKTAPLAPIAQAAPSQESLLAGLSQRRPDYRRLQVELSQTELEASSRKTQYLPTLGAYGSWEADNPSITDAGGSNWTAGLSLRWNVFSGGSDSALLQAARHRVDQKRLQLKALESAMALEIHKALIEYASAGEQVRAMQAAEAQSQESLRILENRYEAGLATMTDLLAAESARSAARMGSAAAIYEQHIAFAQLQYAAGNLNPASAVVR